MHLDLLWFWSSSLGRKTRLVLHLYTSALQISSLRMLTFFFKGFSVCLKKVLFLIIITLQLLMQYFLPELFLFAPWLFSFSCYFSLSLLVEAQNLLLRHILFVCFYFSFLYIIKNREMLIILFPLLIFWCSVFFLYNNKIGI